MPRIAPLMRMPSETPCGTGTPSTSVVSDRPNISSTASTSPTGQAIAWPALRSRSNTRGKLRLTGRDLVDLVAPAAVQRDVGAVAPVDRRPFAGVVVHLADVGDTGVVAAAPVDIDQPRVVPLVPG